MTRSHPMQMRVAASSATPMLLFALVAATTLSTARSVYTPVTTTDLANTNVAQTPVYVYDNTNPILLRAAPTAVPELTEMFTSSSTDCTTWSNTVNSEYRSDSPQYYENHISLDQTCSSSKPPNLKLTQKILENLGKLPHSTFVPFKEVHISQERNTLFAPGFANQYFMVYYEGDGHNDYEHIVMSFQWSNSLSKWKLYFVQFNNPPDISKYAEDNLLLNTPTDNRLSYKQQCTLSAPYSSYCLYPMYDGDSCDYTCTESSAMGTSGMLVCTDGVITGNILCEAASAADTESISVPSPSTFSVRAKHYGKAAKYLIIDMPDATNPLVIDYLGIFDVNGNKITWSNARTSQYQYQHVDINVDITSPITVDATTKGTFRGKSPNTDWWGYVNRADSLLNAPNEDWPGTVYTEPQGADHGWHSHIPATAHLSDIDSANNAVIVFKDEFYIERIEYKFRGYVTDNKHHLIKWDLTFSDGSVSKHVTGKKPIMDIATWFVLHEDGTNYVTSSNVEGYSITNYFPFFVSTGDGSFSLRKTLKYPTAKYLMFKYEWRYAVQIAEIEVYSGNTKYTLDLLREWPSLCYDAGDNKIGNDYPCGVDNGRSALEIIDGNINIGNNIDGDTGYWHSYWVNPKPDDRIQLVFTIKDDAGNFPTDPITHIRVYPRYARAGTESWAFAGRYWFGLAKEMGDITSDTCYTEPSYNTSCSGSGFVWKTRLMDAFPHFEEETDWCTSDTSTTECPSGTGPLNVSTVIEETMFGDNVYNNFYSFDAAIDGSGNTAGVRINGQYVHTTTGVSYTPDTSIPISFSDNVMSVLQLGESILGSGEASKLCGDGLNHGNEGCDDSNTDNSDGCSDVCSIESNYYCQSPAFSTVFTTSSCIEAQNTIGNVELTSSSMLFFQSKNFTPSEVIFNGGEYVVSVEEAPHVVSYVVWDVDAHTSSGDADRYISCAEVEFYDQDNTFINNPGTGSQSEVTMNLFMSYNYRGYSTSGYDTTYPWETYHLIDGTPFPAREAENYHSALADQGLAKRFVFRLKTPRALKEVRFKPTASGTSHNYNVNTWSLSLASHAIDVLNNNFIVTKRFSDFGYTLNNVDLRIMFDDVKQAQIKVSKNGGSTHYFLTNSTSFYINLLAAKIYLGDKPDSQDLFGASLAPGTKMVQADSAHWNYIAVDDTNLLGSKPLSVSLDPQNYNTLVISAKTKIQANTPFTFNLGLYTRITNANSESNLFQYIIWTTPALSRHAALANLVVEDSSGNQITGANGLTFRKDLSEWTEAWSSGFTIDKMLDGSQSTTYYTAQSSISLDRDKKFVFMLPNPTSISKIIVSGKNTAGDLRRCDSYSFHLAMNADDVIKDHFAWSYHMGIDGPCTNGNFVGTHTMNVNTYSQGALTFQCEDESGNDKAVFLGSEFKVIKLHLKKYKSTAPEKSTAIVDGKEIDLGYVQNIQDTHNIQTDFDKLETVVFDQTVVYGTARDITKTIVTSTDAYSCFGAFGELACGGSRIIDNTKLVIAGEPTSNCAAGTEATISDVEYLSEENHDCATIPYANGNAGELNAAGYYPVAADSNSWDGYCDVCAPLPDVSGYTNRTEALQKCEEWCNNERGCVMFLLHSTSYTCQIFNSVRSYNRGSCTAWWGKIKNKHMINSTCTAQAVNSLSLLVVPQSYVKPPFLTIGNQLSLVHKNIDENPSINYVVLTAQSRVEMLELFIFDENYNKVTFTLDASASINSESFSSSSISGIYDNVDMNSAISYSYISNAENDITLVFQLSSSAKVSKIEIIPRWKSHSAAICESWKLYGFTGTEAPTTINRQSAAWFYDLRDQCDGKVFSSHPDVENGMYRVFVDVKMLSLQVASESTTIGSDQYNSLYINIMDGSTSSVFFDGRYLSLGTRVINGNDFLVSHMDSLSALHVNDKRVKVGISSDYCGDGLIMYDEECDDGNAVDLGGCSSDCKVEARYNCSSQKLDANIPYRTNSVEGSCLLMDLCNDNFVDNSAYFHKQRIFHRIDHSEITTFIRWADNINGLANHIVGNSGTDPAGAIHLFDEEYCAVANPRRNLYNEVDQNCNFHSSSTTEILDVTWSGGGSKYITKVLMDYHKYQADDIDVKFYTTEPIPWEKGSSVCTGTPVHTTNTASWTSLATTYTEASFTVYKKQIELSLDNIRCISFLTGNKIIVSSIKLYEGFGHIEECDGESYCDPQTCQLLPNAWCKPRPDPIPTLLYSAKRSIIMDNFLFSGLMESISSPTYTDYPRLEPVSSAEIFRQTVEEDKPVLQGFDVQPAGATLSLGYPDATWTAFVKLSGTSTDIASFTVGADTDVKLRYRLSSSYAGICTGSDCTNPGLICQQGTTGASSNTYVCNSELKWVVQFAGSCLGTTCTSLGTICKYGTNGAPAADYECAYDSNGDLKWIEMSNYVDLTGEAGLRLSVGRNVDILPIAIDTEFETFVALVFEASSVKLYAANEGSSALNVISVVSPGGNVYLNTIHISTVDYLTMSTIYRDEALDAATVFTQFDFQDEYGAGRNCTENDRNNDGIVDNNEGCDDANNVNNDGCSSTSTVEVGYECTNSAYWDKTKTISSITFADKTAQVEEVQLFDSSNSQITDFTITTTKEQLIDNTWNVPGQTEDLANDINGVTLTFSTNPDLEYIRIYNSRVSTHDSTQLSGVGVNVQYSDGSSSNFKIGIAEEWNGRSDDGYCSKAKYPCFIDLVHDATQSTCVLLPCEINTDVYEFSGTCSSFVYGDSCNIQCKSDASTVNSYECGVGGAISGLHSCGGTCIVPDYEVFDNAISTGCDVGDSKAHLQACVLECRTGFSGSSTTYTCSNGDFGTWADPNCTPNPCDISSLDAVENDIHNCTGITTEQTCVHECDSGYTGTSEILTCEASGSLTTSTLSCSAICGDNQISGAETCDDGNTDNGDGCSSGCSIEDGWKCSHKWVKTSDSTSEPCVFPFTDATYAGGVNGGIQYWSPATGSNGISKWCATSSIYNGGTNWYYVEAITDCTQMEEIKCLAPNAPDAELGTEFTCQSGPTDYNDDCSLQCKTGYIGDATQTATCTNYNSFNVFVAHECSTVCGDGIRLGDEICDNGVGDSDGCSNLCTIEQGWKCVDGTDCTQMEAAECGDGIRVGSETANDKCDEGGLNPDTAIAIQDVSTGGSQYYTINDQQDPTLYLIVGQTYTITKGYATHPFLIRNSTNYVTSCPGHTCDADQEGKICPPGAEGSGGIHYYCNSNHDWIILFRADDNENDNKCQGSVCNVLDQVCEQGTTGASAGDYRCAYDSNGDLKWTLTDFVDLRDNALTSGSITFTPTEVTKPGSVTYSYVCTSHSAMTGSIIVRPGNSNDHTQYGCSETCNVNSGWAYDGGILVVLCGDNEINAGETCDDGNDANGDGCSSVCSIEDGWKCKNDANCIEMEQITCTVPALSTGDFAYDPSTCAVGDEKNKDHVCTVQCNGGFTGNDKTITCQASGSFTNLETMDCVQNDTPCNTANTKETSGSGAAKVCICKAGYKGTLCNDAVPAESVYVAPTVTEPETGFSDTPVATIGTREVKMQRTDVTIPVFTIAVSTKENASLLDIDNSKIQDVFVFSADTAWEAAENTELKIQIENEPFPASHSLHFVYMNTTSNAWEKIRTEKVHDTLHIGYVTHFSTYATQVAPADCGNGYVEGEEQCDDVTPQGADGCSDSCTVEDGWTCSGGTLNTPSVCSSQCGDGNKVGSEACDDGNTASGDGCSSGCSIEDGFNCPGAGVPCQTVCGDGLLRGAEQCDDNDVNPGDGCSDICTIENGYQCVADSGCTQMETICGDGKVIGGEECDDGNTASGDGCSDTCRLESTHFCTGGSTSTASTCTSCNEHSQTCDNGKYLSGCGTSNAQGTCESCTNAVSTSQYYSTNGGTASDGCSVASCDASQCSVGEWLSGCGSGTNGTCSACDTVVSTGARYLSAGIGSSDSCSIGLWNDGTKDAGGPAADGTEQSYDAEECDNGNKIGCLNGEIQVGYVCPGSGTTCEPECGNGMINETESGQNEACDDGDTSNKDGCSSSCTIEIGYQCVDGSGCTQMEAIECNDGKWAEGAEECDTADGAVAEGCNQTTCKRIPGYVCSRSGEGSVCRVAVVPVHEGCAKLEVEGEVTYAIGGINDVSLFDELHQNRTAAQDGDYVVDNCIVCTHANGATIKIEAPTADRPLSTIPQFKAGCTVVWLDDSSNFLCPAASCGNVRMTGNEQCDNGDTTGAYGCSTTCQIEPFDESKRYTAAVTQNSLDDGYIFGQNELFDKKVSSGSTLCLDSIIENGGTYYIKEDCPSSDASTYSAGGVEYNELYTKNEYATYEVKQHGKRGSGTLKSDPAVIEIVRKEPFKEAVFVQILSKPSQAEVKLKHDALVPEAEVEDIYIECANSYRHSGQTQNGVLPPALLTAAELTAITDECTQVEVENVKNCKIAQNDLMTKLIVTGEYANDLTAVDSNNRPSSLNYGICGGTGTRLEALNARVYIMPKNSGNMYVSVETLRTKGGSGEHWIVFPYLLNINYQVKLLPSDITALHASITNADLTESASERDIDVEVNEHLEMVGLDKSALVRIVDTHMHMANRYTLTGQVDVQSDAKPIASLAGNRTVYFTEVQNGPQNMVTKVSVPAYENTPAQHGPFSVAYVSRYINCDDYETTTASTSKGFVKFTLNQGSGSGVIPLNGFNEFFNDDEKIMLIVDPLLAELFVSGAKLKYNDILYTIVDVDRSDVYDAFEPAFRSTATKFGGVFKTLSFGTAALQSANLVTGEFELQYAGEGSSYASYYDSNPATIQAVAHNLQQVTEVELGASGFIPVNENTTVPLTITWNPNQNNDASLTRSWKSVQCCNSNANDGFDFPTYKTGATDIVISDEGRCFTLTSSKPFYQYEDRNAQLSSGVTVDVEPCEFASVNMEFTCNIVAWEPALAQHTESRDKEVESTYSTAHSKGTIAVTPVVQDLQVTDTTSTNFSLTAGDASSTQVVKVCTVVNDAVMTSNCDESEFVTEAKVVLSSLSKQEDGHNSFNMEASQLIYVSGNWSQSGTSLESTTNVPDSVQTQCFEYTLQAQSSASTCGFSSIPLTFSHTVTEGVGNTNTQGSVVYMHVDEQACKPILTNNHNSYTFDQFMEDTPYELKDYFTFARNSDSTCGQTEKITKIEFIISDSAYWDKVRILTPGQDANDYTLTNFFSHNSGVIEVTDFTPFGNIFDTSAVTFVDGLRLGFAEHYNTKSNATIPFKLKVTVEDCDGNSNAFEEVEQLLAVKARVDSCSIKANSAQIDDSSRLVTGQEIIVNLDARISNLDERRFFKLEIFANMGLEFRMGISQPNVIACNTTVLNAEQTCTIYCSPDGTDPGDADTTAYWEADGNEFKCKYLPLLRVAPMYDRTWNPSGNPINTLPFKCDNTYDNQDVRFKYCEADTGGSASVPQDYILPFDKLLFLKFTASISTEVDQTAREQCDVLSTLIGSVQVPTGFHSYNIKTTDIVGQIAEAVDSLNGNVAVKEIAVTGEQINSNAVSLTLVREPHSRFYDSQNSRFFISNGLYLMLSNQSDCVGEDGLPISFKLFGNDITNFIVRDEGTGKNFEWGQVQNPNNYDYDKTLNIYRADDETNFVVSDCTVSVTAVEKDKNPVFFPFYTDSARFDFKVTANIGRVIINIGTHTTVTQTQSAQFNVVFERVDGFDGVLEVPIGFAYDSDQCKEAFNGEDPSSPVTKFVNGETLITFNNRDDQAQTLQFDRNPLAKDCNLVFKINNVDALNQAGEVAKVWMTGELGRPFVEIANMNDVSKSLLIGAASAEGQAFTLNRTNYRLPVKIELRPTDNTVQIQPSEFIFVGEDAGVASYNQAKQFTVFYSNANNVNSILDVQAKMYTLNTQNGEYDIAAGEFSTVIDGNDQFLNIVDDIDGTEKCLWARLDKVEAVQLQDFGYPQPATSYSTYVDTYVQLTENAAVYFGDFYDKIKYIVKRPQHMEGDIKFKIGIKAFDDKVGIFPLTASHFTDQLATVYDMPNGMEELEIVLQLKNDDLNHGTEQLGFLYVEYDPLMSVLTYVPDTAGNWRQRIIDSCNAKGSANTAFDRSVIAEIDSYEANIQSARRLLNVVSKRHDGSGNIKKTEDDVSAPFSQVITTDAASVNYWSSAQIKEWTSAMDLELEFQLPVYGQEPTGAFAMIGACPTNVSTLFSQMASCNTYGGPQTGSTIEIVRKLVGLDDAYPSFTNCSNSEWPCPARYQDSNTFIGFDDQSHGMTGRYLTSSAGETYPVYPYRFKKNLAEMMTECTGVDGGSIVTTSSDSEETSYQFQTCIVMYSPRFKERTNSDVLMHTVQQHISLQSSDEAVVTAIMFETQESIRVSMLPKQHQCASASDCSAAFGPQYACSSNVQSNVFLALDTAIDVPIDAVNLYKATGVRDVGGSDNGVPSIEKAGTGCHWGDDLYYSALGTDADIVVTEITKTEKINGQDELIHYVRTQFKLRTPCMSADNNGVVVNDVFSTCAAGSGDAKDYDFKAQLVSCKTVDLLRKCARGNTTVCDSSEFCINTGNRQQKTTIKASVNFIEQLPNVDLTKTTAIQLEAQTFKMGSKDPVDYASNLESFTHKDTLIFAVAPKVTDAFIDESFALTCPEKYIAAYNPVSEMCTTTQARQWTYASRADDVEVTCSVGNACDECNTARFPQGLKGQSVLFDRATQVVICDSDGTAKRIIQVSMLDFVHPLWTSFYVEDWRATAAANCEAAGTCQRPCLDNSLAQTEQGCGNCKHAGSFGNGQWVLPILAATPIVLQGEVPASSSSIIDSTDTNVQVCKHAGADASDPLSYGARSGFNQNTVCNSTNPLAANKPRHCGFLGLHENNKFNEQAFVSAGASIFCGALLANTLYSISAHCYITNCAAQNANMSNYGRRLFGFDEHDVVVEGGEPQRHSAAAGARFFHVLGDTTTTTTESDVVGLGSTIAITLGVVALVVIGLMSVSWIYLYRRAYGSALPLSVPVQQRTPLLYQPAGAQASSWNF